MKPQYQAPQVRDYGTILELTQATGFVNQEDGGNKLLIHHVTASTPPSP